MTADERSQVGEHHDSGFNWLAFGAMLLASIPLYAAWGAAGPDDGVVNFIGDVVIAAILILLYIRVDRRRARGD